LLLDSVDDGYSIYQEQNIAPEIYHKMAPNYRQYVRRYRPAVRRSRVSAKSGAVRTAVRTIAMRTTPRQKKCVSTDPPILTESRSWKRTIRYQPSDAATAITHEQLCLAEAQYYGIAAARWRFVKVYALKAYGRTGTEQIVITPIAAVSGGTESVAASYSDFADKNHRACVSLELPASNDVWASNSTQPVITFAAGSVQCVDFYVELQ